jgi:hypothetical protein
MGLLIRKNVVEFREFLIRMNFIGLRESVIHRNVDLFRNLGEL